MTSRRNKQNILLITFDRIRVSDIIIVDNEIEGKVNKKFVGPMPGNKKDLLLRADRAEQALAKIKISKGQQQLLSKVPEIQNQIKFIDDELGTVLLELLSDSKLSKLRSKSFKSLLVF